MMTTMTTNTPMPSAMMPTRAPPISSSLFGLCRLELTQESGDAAVLVGGDQGLDLVPVEPVAVPARAAVDVHGLYGDDLHFAGAADAATVARLHEGRGRECRLEGIPRAAAEAGELVDFAAVEPSPAAAEAAVDLDAVQLKHDQ